MSASIRTISRREFLKTSALFTGGLVLAACIPETVARAAGPFTPNLWVSIDTAGKVQVTFAWNELGQGAMTSLAMTAADELDAIWTDVTLHTPVWEPKYGYNVTGGSSSMRRSWQPLREAAAAARTMLVEAAAKGWGVPAADCRSAEGRVHHDPSGRSALYGELAAAAAELTPPENPVLKTRADWTLIGKSVKRLDTVEKNSGRARFGLDLPAPGVPFAAAARCPSFGGKIRSVDEGAALEVKGVRRVVKFDDWVAVLADEPWSAMTGRDALAIDWDRGRNAGAETAAMIAELEQKISEPGLVLIDDDDALAKLEASQRTITGDYRVPLISHAPLEPATCIAHYHDGICEIEGPTQGPVIIANAIARALDIGRDKVKVKSTLVGGAFGRRLYPNYAVEAALLSRRIDGPVRIIWSREDEMRNDRYRPCSLHRLQAGLNAQGQLTAFVHRIATPPLGAYDDGEEALKQPDRSALAGVHDTAYRFPALRAEHAPVGSTVPLGALRSVYNTQNAFANECFLDEVALAAGRDPLELRLENLSADSRMRRVIETAARATGWPKPPSAGRGFGFACHFCFDSYGAQVAEVSVDRRGELKVERIVSVIECGPAVNPDAVRAQMEGGVAMGLSIALHEEVTITGGGVSQGNFDEYRILRMDEMPVVETHIIESDLKIGGIGEPVLPPTAPAVCNAIFAACGVRIRKLPIAQQIAAALG